MTPTVNDVERLANKLIDYHNVDVRFEWSRAKNSLGACHYLHGEPYKLTLSKPWVPYLTYDDVRDTILHEIAHAKAGHAHGHNHIWKNWARKLGADPTRTADIPVDIEERFARDHAKYMYACTNDNCDITGYRNRISRNFTYRCNKCKSIIEFTPNPRRKNK